MNEVIDSVVSGGVGGTRSMYNKHAVANLLLVSLAGIVFVVVLCGSGGKKKKKKKKSSQ